MPTDDPHMTDPRQLSRMLDIASTDSLTWTETELAEILQHQLQLPLAPELERIIPGAETRIAQISERLIPPISSFLDLLTHRRPPLELLKLVKEFAKLSPNHPDHPIPADIGRVIYFAAILVAQRQCGERISNLEDARLREGLQWVLAQPWLDQKTRDLFQASPGRT